MTETNRILISVFNNENSTENEFNCTKRTKTSSSLQLPGLSQANMEILNSFPFIKVSLIRVFKVCCEMCTSNQVKMSTSLGQDVTQSLEELSQLQLYLFDRLNTGHWKSVDPIWRIIYSLVCLMKVPILLHTSNTLEALKSCDMGLLMGQPICDNILSTLAESISSTLPNPCDSCPSRGLRHYSTVIKNKSKNEFVIEEVKCPSMEQFSGFIKSQVPVKLYGIIEHWKALHKWNVEYIRKVAGFRTVPVEIGSKYDSEDWTQKVMTLNDFIDEFILKENKEVGYVAQYSLFDQIPTLKSDIAVPDYVFLKPDAEDTTIPETNAWFGPANTISPTHHDPKDNIFVQVFGTKTIRLFPPSESSILEPYPEGSLLFNTSQLDVEANDLFQCHPRMINVKHCDVVINSGECLYMPPGWWHYVRSCTESFSVSFWF